MSPSKRKPAAPSRQHQPGKIRKAAPVHRANRGHTSTKEVWREEFRSLIDPDNYIGPGYSYYSVESPGHAKVLAALDTQMIVSGVARRIIQGSAPKWTVTSAGLHPDGEHTRTIVIEVRKAFDRRVGLALREFLDGLLEDLYYESLLALGGEIRYPATRDSVKKRWKGAISARVAKMRRNRSAREGTFPTRFLLRNALLEALGQILAGGHKERVKQSEVVNYFREHPKYASCGEESTLRYWLRRHGFRRWEQEEKALRQELKHQPVSRESNVSGRSER
jgi:hypothetical protein